MKTKLIRIKLTYDLSHKKRVLPTINFNAILLNNPGEK
jgi:hypothetical protein